MSAVLDPTRTYRYRLDRAVGPQAKMVLFVMLNPSTADETQDDPTIRRCIAFAKREGCGRLVVCNLYALRATDPAALRTAADPRGPENEEHLRRAAAEADLIVAAWGTNHLGGVWPFRVAAILAERKPLYTLKRTAKGDPGHPLYVAANAPLVKLAEPAGGEV